MNTARDADLSDRRDWIHRCRRARRARARRSRRDGARARQQQGGAHRRARRASDRRQSRRSGVVPRGRRGAGRLHPHGVRFDVERRPGGRARGARGDHRRRRSGDRTPSIEGARKAVHHLHVGRLGAGSGAGTGRRGFADSTRVSLVAWRPDHEQLVLQRGRSAVFAPSSFDRASCTAGATASSATFSSRPPTAWCAWSATATITGRWCTTAISRILYARLVADEDAAGLYHANDEGDERVNDIVSAISPYLPVRPDVRHVPIEEARSKMGAFADALALDQVVRSPRATRARLDADAPFGRGQRRAAARGMARVANLEGRTASLSHAGLDEPYECSFAAGSTRFSRAAGARIACRIVRIRGHRLRLR